MPVTRAQSEMVAAAQTLLSLKVRARVAPKDQKAHVAPKARVAPRAQRKAAIIARQLIRLCAESEQD
jgi:hypothetical protein